MKKKKKMKKKGGGGGGDFFHKFLVEGQTAAPSVLALGGKWL